MGKKKSKSTRSKKAKKLPPPLDHIREWKEFFKEPEGVEEFARLHDRWAEIAGQIGLSRYRPPEKQSPLLRELLEISRLFSVWSDYVSEARIDTTPLRYFCGECESFLSPRSSSGGPYIPSDWDAESVEVGEWTKARANALAVWDRLWVAAYVEGRTPATSALRPIKHPSDTAIRVGREIIKQPRQTANEIAAELGYPFNEGNVKQAIQVDLKPLGFFSGRERGWGNGYYPPGYERESDEG